MIATLLLAVDLRGSEVTEPATNVKFSTELPTPAGAQVLTGTGVRTRTMLKVKVYFARFRVLFTDELASGTELLFSWASGNTLRVSIGGRQVGEIDNAALCWALFDVYLGEQPISSDGKKTVIARLPEILGA